MPYIDPEIRDELDSSIDKLVCSINDWRSPAHQAGLINYAVASLIFRLLCTHSFTYNDLNQVIGALECCKLELYRRLVVPYEDKKMQENGDVFNNVRGTPKI